MRRKKPRKYTRKATRPREEVLQQALLDVADREGVYGDPLVNHQRIAILWLAWDQLTGFRNTPFDVVVKEILKNGARLVETPNHKGSWDNIAGYAAIGYEVTK